MDADLILERRRLRRRASFWRAAAFLVLALAGVALLAETPGLGEAAAGRGQVARIAVDGFIATRPEVIEQIEEAAESRSVRAILVRIDSPGGAASGGEALYRALRTAAAQKPVVAVIDGLGASAAYLTAVAADHVVAGESAITGSIGVIFQYGHFEELLERIGADYEEVKSAPLKGQPSPFQPPTAEALAMIQAVVDDSYDWFVGLVAERRGLAPAEARRLADGSIYTGRQAVRLKLVDAVGGEAEARRWLAAERGVPEGLPAVDWEEDDFTATLFGSDAVAGLFRLVGLDPALAPAAGALLPRRLTVDGLLAVWQAPQSVTSHR